MNKPKVLLCVTGGIAAYKIPDLVQRLLRANVVVRIIMTESAKAFVSPLTLQVLSGFPVRDSLWDQEAEKTMSHIELARWADVILIAPTTANCIAKLACGIADDSLTTVCLASTALLIAAPAMNSMMWHHFATQANIKTLKQRGVVILDPDNGEQACGEIGIGPMQEPAVIVEYLSAYFSETPRHRFCVSASSSILLNKSIMITAGPTQEAIDPVRYITNHSSGKMGYALAERAAELGGKVILISGPSALSCSTDIIRIDVKTAREMREAVMASIHEIDLFIGAAAVGDYRVENISANKIKKQNSLTLTLIKNPDILAEIAGLKKRPFVVGFAAETNNVVEYARQKLAQKKIDMIIANFVNQPDQGFYADNNCGWLLTSNETVELPFMSKRAMANEILQKVIDLKLI